MHATRPTLILAALSFAACTGADPVTNTTTVTHTEYLPGEEVIVEVEVEVPVPDTSLQPGHFMPPLVQLQKLQDNEGVVGTNGSGEPHMHIDEVQYRESDARLFYCAYTFGVIDVADPEDAEYLAQGFEHVEPLETDPGCVHLALDEDDTDIVYTTHRGNNDNAPLLSGWDLNTLDPYEPNDLAPFQLPVLQEPGVSYEGVDSENGLVYVAIHDDGLGVYDLDPVLGWVRVGGSTAFTNAYDVKVVGNTAYVVDQTDGLIIVDVTDPTNITELGRVATGGLARDITIDGTLAYIASGSAGLVIVDVANPAAPAICSSTPTPGTAQKIGYDAGRVVIAAWNDTRVYDVTDPMAPTIIGIVRNTLNQDFGTDLGDREEITARTLGADIFGDVLFVGNWWTPYTYQIHADRTAPHIILPEETQYLGFGTVEPGTPESITIDVANHGTAPLTVYDTWIDSPQFTVSPRQVLIEPGQEAQLTVTFSPTSLDEEVGYLHVMSDDPNQPIRGAYLVGNAVGIGVGDPLPTTEATLVDGTPWTSASVQGEVLFLAYFATFCPVCGTQMPDLESQFHQTYASQGLKVVGLDADEDDYLNAEGVHRFVEQMGVSFPIGLEEIFTTPTYDTIEGIHDGANPFPVDILVDKNGIIRYIAREYDPEALHDLIPVLLAE